MLKFPVILLTAMAAVISISSDGVARTIPAAKLSSADFYLMERPDERQRNPDNFFTHEYEQINYRRNRIIQSDRPGQLTGLAFSGGGIRSAAYQQGLLSGLHATGLLPKIDYLSAVSGGSWAAGSYWASTEHDDDLFGCLVSTAETGDNKCSSSVLLNSEQPFAELPVSGMAIKARKRQWRDYIESIYLPECNIDAEEVEKVGVNAKCAENYQSKPYLIVNASHSVSTFDQKGNEDNVPFHFTLDELGTLTDCQKDERCSHSESKGFFVRNVSDDFTWVNRSFFKKDEPRNTLGSALAASSAVVAGTALLSYHYELVYNPRLTLLGNMRGDNVEEIRKEIELSDGGKSDNLGLVPLIERGVENIVISYMGKDRDPIDDPWEDLKLPIAQAKRLFGCQFTMPQIDASRSTDFIFDSHYQCGERQGNILHVKATHNNVGNFIEYLKKNGQDQLATYLNKQDKANFAEIDQFPQTPTMRQKYDQQLIRAYFLLGRWVAMQHLSTRMSD